MRIGAQLPPIFHDPRPRSAAGPAASAPKAAAAGTQPVDPMKIAAVHRNGASGAAKVGGESAVIASSNPMAYGIQDKITRTPARPLSIQEQMHLQSGSESPYF